MYKHVITDEFTYEEVRRIALSSQSFHYPQYKSNI